MTIKDLPYMPPFFDQYILQVSEDTHLISGLSKTKNDFDNIKEQLLSKQDYRYQPEKWTPKDILQHVIDNERIQTYRALAFARGDKAILPGFDEQLYAQNTNANDRTIEELLEEFMLIRRATIILFKGFSEEQLLNEGVAFEVKVTPAALGFQLIGHMKHHIRVLHEQYFC